MVNIDLETGKITLRSTWSRLTLRRGRSNFKVDIVKINLETGKIRLY